MSDFFSQVAQADTGLNNQPDDTKTFAEAIAARFGQGDNVLTARLLHIPNTPMANLSIVPLASSEYTAVPPNSLEPWLDDPHTLVVDIRPHAAYSSARLARAVSLSVPSTLLKRPLFSLQRLSAMLPSHSARTRFAAWRQAPRILVYDADSAALSDTSNIQGLLRKFRAEAPDATTQLAWVQGGFQAVWSLRRDLVDVVPPPPESETETDDDDDAVAEPANSRVLRAHNLPRAAFALTSTTQAQGPRNAGKFHKAPRRTTENDVTPPAPTLLHNPPPSQQKAQQQTLPTAAFNPFFDAVRQNTELSHGITERIPLRLPRRVRRRVGELPFQWLRDIARRAGPVGVDSSEDESTSSPAQGHRNHTVDIEEGTEALAMQFYRIELAELRRMMGVMEHHSREKGKEEKEKQGGRGKFPFSITAGVEKGSKNRYRNIWPFEHARVRLHRLHASSHDDYVNASYVQPLGTRRRYIATQGPLEATFGDFWTLVWQQNTHVIVMLTREVEGAMVKCGAYWRGGTYGPLRVELLGCAAEGCVGVCEVCDGAGVAAEGGTSSGGGSGSGGPTTPAPQLIKRTLRLTHAAHPRAPPRRVVQLQYLGWPDMNVPEDARGVLGLVWEVGRCVEEVGAAAEAGAVSSGGSGSDSEVDATTGVLRRALRAGDAAAPVLLHCSAGVGRTGGFIAVDAVLDAVRWEAREMYAGAAARTSGSGSAGGSFGSSGSGEGIGVISAGMRASGISAGARAVAEDGEGDDRMDVDVEVQVEDADADAEGEMHEGRGMRTPMQVDSAEVEMEMGLGSAAGDSTRRWAEHVADTKSGFAPGSLPTTTSAAFPLSLPPSATASTTSFPPGSLGAPFQFQPPAHRTTFSLTMPAAQRSLPTAPSASPSSAGGSPRQSPENKAASLPLKGAASQSPVPARVLADRPLANSPLPDRPRSLSPFSAAAAPTHRSIHSLDSVPDDAALAAFAQQQRTKTQQQHMDHKAPRALHGRGGAGPVRLSGFEDPIWEVVQDMREQRMSLCQSLRQYVFVHAAIIEGALMVVDEERARAGVAWRMPAPVLMRRPGAGMTMRPGRPALFLRPSDEERLSTTSSTGKRLASPTELTKEDKKGEIALSKRPSLKRKQASGDEYAPPLSTYPPP
ncbi:hypothetical protein B0H16DRAFT_1294690 [Mycena metata]|uniref:protein-tyrosine-phosphatase n=1 Tax=Mycena metata TaxID=1033252 RepID=A0AAD7KHD3_9AGAR|nr:hypothetical protein B0H16DRAFT_1294690 [Mycena metata]